MNPLLELRRHKQSIWLDYIRRDLVRGGDRDEAARSAMSVAALLLG